MNLDLRFPNITATTPSGQVAQLQSYMYQMVQQLNWSLNTIDAAIKGDASNVVMSKPSTEITQEEAQNTFNSIKALIIKSADIVKAYEETIKQDFSGEYLAISDFGTYSVQTNAKIEQNSKGVTEIYNNVQKITNPDGTGSLDEINAYIKRGLLGYDEESGTAIYGLAIGETSDDGSYKKYAWFTPTKLSFFDESGNQVAYISNERLYITDAIFLGTVQFGGYKADTSDGLAFTWIGG